MIFGHTRYSVFNPDASSWRAAKFLNVEEYKNFLFSNSRLDMREKIFRDFSIPQIKRNMESCQDYYHIIEYSQELPEGRKNNLFEFCDVHNQIIPVLAGKRNEKIQEILNNDGRGRSSVGVFKLDDDDVISDNYIFNAKKYINKGLEGFVVSFPKGLTAWFDSELGAYSVVKKVYHPKINIGLMAIFPVVTDFSGLRKVKFFQVGRHTTCDERHPVILDASFSSFIWTRSGVQDTSINKEKFDEHTMKKLNRLEGVTPSDFKGFETLSSFFKVEV